MNNLQDTVFLMDSLGFTIHPNKSVLKPTQTISFVGFILNSISMTVCLTPEKAYSLILCCKELLRLDAFSIREFARVIGKMVASQPGVFHAPLFYKNREIEKNQQLKLNKGDYDAIMVLNEDCRLTLQWWIDNVHKECNSIQRVKPDIVIRSDSSGFGWGGVSVTDQRQTGGYWSIEELVIRLPHYFT